MARTISLKAGSTIFYGTVEYEVLESAGLTSIKVRDVANGQIRIISLGDVLSHSVDAPAPPSTPLDCLSPEKQTIALKEFDSIKEALITSLSRKEIEELAKKHNVHWTTIYRKIRKYAETGSPASLVPKTGNRGGKGQRRVEPAVDDVIRLHFEEIIKSKKVDITKVTVKSLYRDIKAKCRNLKLKPPAYGTVDNRLEAFILEKKLERRRGRRKVSRRVTAGGEFPNANFPLDVVQIDHTPLDIILVDEKYREPIGRAILSIAIDVFSRVILGFSISLDHPGIFTVGQLIAHCILPKDHFIEKLGVEAKWDFFGMMRTLNMDNAGEFRSEDFIPFQAEYNVEISWRPVGTPEYGGHIERLAKTLNDKIHDEPGSTFSDINARGDFDSEGTACYTIDEIERWLTHLITRIYHEEKHSSLGMSPRQKYELGILGDENTVGIGLPDIVEDQERLELFLLPSEERTVQRHGVELDKIIYFHDILRHWVGKKDERGKARKYMFKRNPRDISRLYFFDPDRQEYFAIPYRDLTRPPISLWDLDASKKRCKEKGINDPDEQQIFDAYADLRAIREESLAKTKRARREREAEKRRRKGSPTGKLNAAAPVAAPKVSSNSVIDIDDFYDDATLLDGVSVKKTIREG